MYTSSLYFLVPVLLGLLGTAHGKAVFGHYLLGSTTEAHTTQDVDDAIAVGLDGFALNVGDPTQAYVATTLGYLFDYAAGKDFKLFISMDLSASSAACAAGSSCCNGPDDYETILSQYKGNTAYYLGPNGLPMISTFQSGGVLIDAWNAWKQYYASDMYFIPMFDDTADYYTADDSWWSYWGDLVDGLFSWESAWPAVGDTDLGSIGDLSLETPVINGASANHKGYMIALSTLQYKDSYGTNLFRQGNLNLPVRMSNILKMSTQPNFVEIITWNDGPESHYIGNLWPEVNNDPQAEIYATQATYPHTAWQPLITSFIQAFKAGGTTSSMTTPGNAQAVGALWYKTILQDTTCPETQPQGWDTGTDSLNWAVVVAAGSSGMQVRAISNGVVVQNTTVYPGMNWGSPSGVQAGVQALELVDASGNVVMSGASGKCVEQGCPDGIYNMNYQVVGLDEGSSTGGSC